MKQAANGDIESGNAKKKQNQSDESGLTTAIAVIIALLIIIAACSVSWVYQGWETGLLVFACSVIIFAFAFHWHWFYIACVTTPRDMS